MKSIAMFLASMMLLAGCSKPAENFAQVKEASLKELQVKTEASSVWGMEKFKRWDLHQDSGLLVFSDPDGSTATAKAQIIGSFDSTNGSWEWAWANPHVSANMKSDSFKVRAYGEKNRFDDLTDEKVKCDEAKAWALAAIASKVCDSAGIYRGPASTNLFVFISFGKVELSKAR